MGINWAVFGMCLALCFVFGIWYAWLVRWLAWHQIGDQTAYLVVLGVTVTLLLGGFVIGWGEMAAMFGLFAASGAPMVVEYITRTQAELRRDREQAERISRELLK